MAAIAGRSFCVKVSPTAGGAGAYTVVASINSATMTRARSTSDISSFGDSDVARLAGLRDCSYQLSGFYEAADTNGQNAIRAACDNDTTLWVQFLPDGTVGFKQEVKVESYEIGEEVNGVAAVTYSLAGTGAIATV